MICPDCKGPTKVIDTDKGEVSIRRRRECKDCGFRFTTYEIIADDLRDLREAKRMVIDAMLVTLDEVLVKLRGEGIDE